MNLMILFLKRAVNLLLGYVIIGVLWQVLELWNYGEIQPRVVDDIISLFFIAFVIRAYKKGLEDGKELKP